MIIHRKTENYETARTYYQVIGYVRGKSIARDEEGNLYYCQCSETEAPIGTVAAAKSFSSIGKLSQEEQEAIDKVYKGV